MEIDKQESKIVVTLDGKKIRYGSEWFEEKAYLHETGVKYLEEWKIDLIKNHGVEYDEL